MQNPSASFLERHIRLVNKLDRLRDKMDAGTHPSTVFDEIAATLQVLFAADACALLLEDSDDRYLIHHGMDAALADQTAEIALNYEVISTPMDEGAYRTDLAQAALDSLAEDMDDLDLYGEDWEPVDAEVTPYGE